MESNRNLYQSDITAVGSAKQLEHEYRSGMAFTRGPQKGRVSVSSGYETLCKRISVLAHTTNQLTSANLFKTAELTSQNSTIFRGESFQSHSM